jgi:hypothetical protein
VTAAMLWGYGLSLIIKKSKFPIESSLLLITITQSNVFVLFYPQALLFHLDFLKLLNWFMFCVIGQFLNFRRIVTKKKGE